MCYRSTSPTLMEYLFCALPTSGTRSDLIVSLSVVRDDGVHVELRERGVVGGQLKQV